METQFYAVPDNHPNPAEAAKPFSTFSHAVKFAQEQNNRVVKEQYSGNRFAWEDDEQCECWMVYSINDKKIKALNLAKSA